MLVYPHRIDVPVGILEALRAISNKVVAARPRIARCHGAAGISPERRAGPVTAEGDVENDCVVLEVVVDITTTLEVGHWHSKFRDIWRAGTNAGWHVGAREEPDANPLRCPFHGVHLPALSVRS